MNSLGAITAAKAPGERKPGEVGFLPEVGVGEQRNKVSVMGFPSYLAEGLVG